MPQFSRLICTCNYACGSSVSQIVHEREIFLRVVKQAYWEQIKQGVLPSDDAAANYLLTSVDLACDEVQHGLVDWDVLEPHCLKDSLLVQFLNMIDGLLPRCILADNWVHDLFVVHKNETALYIVGCFVEAHRHAQVGVVTSRSHDEHFHRN